MSQVLSCFYFIILFRDLGTNFSNSSSSGQGGASTALDLHQLPFILHSNRGGQHDEHPHFPTTEAERTRNNHIARFWETLQPHPSSRALGTPQYPLSSTSSAALQAWCPVDVLVGFVLLWLNTKTQETWSAGVQPHLIGYSPSWREASVGPGGRNWSRGHRKTLLTGLLFMRCLTCFLMQPKTIY